MTPLPENVELCNDCGCAPILPESVVLTTPKWVYRLWGECRCTEDLTVYDSCYTIIDEVKHGQRSDLETNHGNPST